MDVTCRMTNSSVGNAAAAYTAAVPISNEGCKLLRVWLVISTVLLAAVPQAEAWAEAAAVFSDTGPDAAAYGDGQHYPVGPRRALVPQTEMVGTYSHFDQIYPSHLVAKAASPSPLRRATQELALHYRYQGQDHGIDDYLDRNPATGLLIARDDTILFEHYRYARTGKDRFLSQSMAKTVTAMLIGIAVQEGAIHSIDQPAADYVPELTGTEYGKTPIRALLHMASGVAFHETYDGTDDIAQLGRLLFRYDSPGTARAVATFNHRDVPPDTRFHYASIETEVLGLVLTRAVHTTPASYLQSRIWQQIGTEADATWVTDANGQEATYCCFSATLRDWARFGMLLAHDGAWHDRQIIPRQWVLDATTAAAPWLEPQTAPVRYGYGFQVWLLPGPRRQFALLGVHGQAIMIDPAAGLVLVHTAVRLKPSQDPSARELRVLWNALVARYAG